MSYIGNTRLVSISYQLLQQTLKEAKIMKGVYMLIHEISEGIWTKKLKKPLEITISKHYIAENEDLELFGEGNTEEEAVEDIKEVFLDRYEDLLTDEEFTTGGEEYRKNFLAYVE